MGFFDYILYIILAINTILSLGILLRDRSTRTNQLYFLFVTFLDLWIISNYLENTPQIVGLSGLEVALRLDFTFALLSILSWYYFGKEFTRTQLQSRIHRWLEKIILICTAVLIPLSLFGNFIIQGIRYNGEVIEFSGGSLWLLYAVVMVYFAIGGLVVLYHGLVEASAKNNLVLKRQIRLIFVGFSIAIGIAILVNLYIQPFFDISLEFSRLGLYCMTFWVIFTGYAIANTRLFELRILILRAIAFLLFIISFCAAYIFLLAIMMKAIFHLNVNFSTLLVFTFITVIATFTFGPIERYLRVATNRIFLKNYYDSSELLDRLTKIMASKIDLEDLTISILKDLLATLHVKKGAFLLLNEKRTSQIKKIGYLNNLVSFPTEEVLKTLNQELFLFELLDESALKEVFRKMDISVAIPIRVKGEAEAILLLGPKLTGERYEIKDLDVLKILAQQSGVAIQNAKAYFRIKKFNEELEQKVLERTAELAKANEQLKALDKARADFITIASHQLRTPPATIKWYLSSIINGDYGQIDESVKDHLKRTMSTNNSMIALIDDLLNVSRIERGKLEFMFEPTDILEITRITVDQLAPQADMKKIALIYEKPKEALPIINADKEKLRQVINNLIDNAVKYTQKGKVAVTVSKTAKDIVVKVSDTGRGIASQQVKSIFEKYDRGESAARNSTGLGLGLYVAKVIIEQHKGKIWAESKGEGKGSDFIFTVPIKTKLSKAVYDLTKDQVLKSKM